MGLNVKLIHLSGVKDLIKLDELDEKQTIVFLIIVSYTVRILLSPFYVMFPHIPHDFYMYIGGGQCMAEGKILSVNCGWVNTSIGKFVYGPFFAALNMMWYMMFGSYDYLMFKLSSIIFDVLNVLMIYLIGKKFFGQKIGLYFGLIYCFSFITLINSAVYGNDENIVMFFILASVYLLIDNKLFASAVLIAISLMFKNVGLITIPVFFYYIQKKYGFKSLLKYVLLSAITFFILLAPFLFIAGFEKSTFSILQTGTAITTGACVSIATTLKYITNMETSLIVVPLMVFGYLITLILIFIRKMKNHDIELFRNMTLIWTATFLFGSALCGRSLYLIFPFLLILTAFVFDRKPIITKRFMFGIFLILISLLIYSVVYRWGVVKYSNLDRILLLLIIFLAPIGVFNLLNDIKMSYRLLWTIIIFAVIIWEEIHAAPLLAIPLKSIAEKIINPSQFAVINKLYGDHIQGSAERFLAYGLFYGGSALILWFSLGLLYLKLLKDNFEIVPKKT